MRKEIALGLALAALMLVRPLTIHSQSKFQAYKLAPDSPLATDGSLVFGVADDHKTLLASPGGTSGLQPVAVRPAPGRISGLAWGRDGLYLADEASRTIWLLPDVDRPTMAARVNARSVRPAKVVLKGGPLQRPGDLAVAGSQLLVADRGAGAVFQIDTRAEAPRAEVLVENLPPGPIHVAADRRAVAVTSPEAGQVRLPAPFEGSVAQKAGSSVSFTVWDTRGAAGPNVERLPQKRVPADVLRPIVRPGDALFTRGSLFLVDEATAAVYVALKEQSRWTRIAPATPIARPAALLAVSDSLLVLDGPEGVLGRWPLPVPTDVDMGRDIRAALEGLYGGLYERRALATRPVRWRGTLDQTLAEERVWDGAPSARVSSVVCGLNAAACTQGQWRTPAQILVPDVPTERVVDLETINTTELEGRTLGDELNRRIVSPTFQDYRTAEELLELNASRLNALHRESTYGKQRYGPYNASNILSLRKDDFPQGFSLTLPTEKQRALIALPRALLREDGWLNEIRLASPGFNWVPLEETEAKAATDPQPPPSPAPPPPPCDMAELKKERQELAKTINAVLPPNLPKVKVGVLEDRGIDVQHPAFGGVNVAFTFIAAMPSPAPPVTTPPNCQTATAEDDHGTAVAGLIASREAGLAGFAPNVQIVPLGASDEAVGQDLFPTWRDQKVRIFNLSLHYDKKLVTNIRQKINELDALFVVAAGNDATDQKQVCESAAQPYPAYPVCEGERRNVLVVAATTLKGDALIDQTTTPRAGGSNWNPNVVQIAAPGTGYHAPTRNNGYAPVRGTSFAAPLVTATAALLFAQGVKEPALIKQRIIATSDPKIGLLGKVFAAGLLNVERAVTAPQNAVLSKGATTKRVDLLLDAQANAIAIKWSGGSRTLPLANVRRLTKNLNGQGYRIIYLDDVTGRLIVQEIDVGSWPLRYQALDAAGNSTGNPVSDQLENYDDYVGPIA